MAEPGGTKTLIEAIDIAREKHPGLENADLHTGSIEFLHTTLLTRYKSLGTDNEIAVGEIAEHGVKTDQSEKDPDELDILAKAI